MRIVALLLLSVCAFKAYCQKPNKTLVLQNAEMDKIQKIKKKRLLKIGLKDSVEVQGHFRGHIDSALFTETDTILFSQIDYMVFAPTHAQKLGMACLLGSGAALVVGTSLMGLGFATGSMVGILFYGPGLLINMGALSLAALGTPLIMHTEKYKINVADGWAFHKAG